MRPGANDERNHDHDTERDDATHVDIEEHVAATPEEVFAYVADPARFPGVADGPVTVGDPLVVEPPHRIAYRVAVADGEATRPGTVEVTLVPDGAGTRVRIVHRSETPRAVRRPHALALAA